MATHILRHAKSSITMETYINVTDEHTREGLPRLGHTLDDREAGMGDRVNATGDA